MKKIFIAAVILTGALLQSACITSLHPLVTPGTIIANNQVGGNWTDDDGVEIRVEKLDTSLVYKQFIDKSFGPKLHPQLFGKEKQDSIYYSKAYSVVFSKNDVNYYMMGSFTRIGNDLFMDLLPLVIEDEEQSEGSGYEFTSYYLQTFSIAKVEVNSRNQLTLKFLNGDYIQKLIRNNKARIKHESDTLFGTFILTASTNELRQFLQKYGHDERLYSADNSVTLTRKG